MQVLFRLIIIYELGKNGQNGYQIIRSIEKHYGKRPSAGSVFPLLDNMIDDKIVSMKKDGRANIYTLTKKGHRIHHEFIKGKEHFLLSLFELYKFLSDGSECDESLIRRIRKNISWIEQMSLLSDIKKLSLTIICAEDFRKKEKKFNSIMKSTIGELEKIC